MVAADERNENSIGVKRSKKGILLGLSTEGVLRRLPHCLLPREGASLESI
jgi:hypothetical protein